MQGVKNTQADEIRALKHMKDSEIDTTGIPPVADWSDAVVGKLYRPAGSQSRFIPTRTFWPG